RGPYRRRRRHLRRRHLAASLPPGDEPSRGLDPARPRSRQPARSEGDRRLPRSLRGPPRPPRAAPGSVPWVSRRGQIKLSEAEVAELLDSERVAVVSSIGPRGWPHSMPLWFVARDGEVWIWTYAKSQKVRNLERDPRATVLVETGEEYGELRGM